MYLSHDPWPQKGQAFFVKMEKVGQMPLFKEEAAMDA